METYKKKLLSFYRIHKRMPNYSEMCELFGFASKNAVTKVVKKFIAAGVVRKDEKGKLVPRSIAEEIPLVGYVEAGLPSPAEEAELDRVSVEEMLLGEREHMYMLRVKGMSMVDAGIHEGDMLLVERTERARVGDIVIANIDGEWTVKYLRQKKNGSQYLEPANEAFHNLFPEHSLTIGGVVRSVVRVYK